MPTSAFIYITHLVFDIFKTRKFKCGPGSLVSIATDYGLYVSGIGSRWGRDFLPVRTGPGAHPASSKMGIGSFTGVKCGRGVLLTTHHLPVPRSWNSRAIPLPTLWATPGLWRDHFTLYLLESWNKRRQGITQKKMYHTNFFFFVLNLLCFRY